MDAEAVSRGLYAGNGFAEVERDERRVLMRWDAPELITGESPPRIHRMRRVFTACTSSVRTCIERGDHPTR